MKNATTVRLADSPGGIRITPLAWVLVVLFAPCVQSGFAEQVAVRTVDGERTYGRLLSFILGENLQWQPEGSAPVTVSTSEVVAITAHQHAMQPTQNEAIVYLANGGRVLGRLGGGDENGFILHNSHMGRMRAPLEQVSAVITPHGRSELSTATIRSALRNQERTGDEVWLANGDRQEVSLISFVPDAVLLDTPTGEAELPLENLLAVFLADSPQAPWESPLKAILRLTDSSELAVERCAWSSEQVRAIAPGWVRITFDPSALVEIEVRGGRWEWLADIEPTEHDQVSLTGLEWPLRVDANVMDEPMRMKGRAYERGIGLHSGAKLIYYLGGRFEAFSAQVGIDDSAGEFADADVEVFVDSRVAHRTSGLQAGRDPVPIRVDLSGAQRLEIAVGFGRNGDIQDRVNLADAALIRRNAAPSNTPNP